MLKDQLFRPEALKARNAKSHGEIVLIRPVSFAFLTGFSAFFAAIVLAFLAWGSYTKRSTIAGSLLPTTGLVKVYAPQPGVVLEKRVLEGEPVKQGEVLYVLSSERQSSTQGNTQAVISSQVQARQQSLREELEKTHLIQEDERDALTKKIAGLHAESEKLESQIAGQRQRVGLAEKTRSRYQGLMTQDYISNEQLQQKQEELLDQRIRLQSQERDLITVQRELAASENELSSLTPKHQNQLAQIERGIASTEQEFSESEAKRRLVVVAPENGIATAVVTEVGQAVDTNKPLVSIVPSGATLQAQLYAPSRAVGFIKTGDAVLLRYQAYPYQKFGHAQGTVASISKTALPGSELTGRGTTSGLTTEVADEPLYRITVNLVSQTVNAYGKAQPLQAGMSLEADVLQDTRRLYEWVLEPLYSLTGKIQ